MRSTARVCNWQSNLISTAIGSYEFGFYHLFLINSMCIKMFFCLYCTVGRPMKRCICENRKAHPISVVFGGWFEGSQEDFWFDYSNALVLNNLRKNVLLFDKCCNTSFMASLSLRGCQICKYKSLLCLRGEIVFYIMQIQRTSMSICMQWARQTFSTKDLENTFPLPSFKHHSSGGNRIFSSQGQA